MFQKVYINAKYKTSFPALLKTPEGKFLESGTATVSVEDGTVDFVNEFVPLFKMGERVTIDRLFQNREIHRFTGEVYLSSEKLLRITAVNDQLLEGSESVFLFPATIAAAVSPFPPEPQEERRTLFHRRTKGHKSSYDVTINTLTIDTLEFSSLEEIPRCPQFTLTIEEPRRIAKLPLVVNRVLEFGPNGKGYFCRIDNMPTEVWMQWEKLVRDLHQQNNKLF